MSLGSKAYTRRRMLSWPVFGLTLGALIAGAGVSQAATPALPTGGKVVSGSAAIGAPGAGALTVTQSSSKAILNWSSFSIGSGGKVAFDNGKGATLNRVTGGGVSSLDGLLSATGSVYLINPKGVIIGRSGVVDVGGTFVASTLDTSDASFLKGGALGFSGASTAQVVNLGKVGALGGDVALIAAQVSNAGSISAPNGSAGLLAGHSVMMLRDGSLDQGRFSVLLGGTGASVTNTGTIAAADAELRAEGGNVYALAGDTAGVIRATGVKSGGGKVWLVAEGGELDLGGAISAQGAGATAGSIETSGGTVKVGSTRIDAHGGNWLVDPYDLTIDATAASTIDQALNAGTSVTEQTTATGYSGAGVASASGKGDITVAAPIIWNTNAGLTLSAYRNINVDAVVTSSRGGAVTLYADNSGVGVGAVNFGSPATVSTAGAVNIFYDPASNPAGSGVNSTSYTNPISYSTYIQGGGALNSYMLVNTVYDLQNIRNYVRGEYALGRDIDASVTQQIGFTPLGDATTPFSGLLEGQDHAVTGLTINAPGAAVVGLFGHLQGNVADLTLLNESVSGGTQYDGMIGGLAGSIDGGLVSNVVVQATVTSTGGASVGGLAGMSIGNILDSSSSGLVTSASAHGGETIGGLVGLNGGSISSSYSSSAVTGSGQNGGLVVAAGGLVGSNQGRLTNVYAVGAVSSAAAGGLVAYSQGAISGAYASGRVSGSGDMAAGFAVSDNGQTTNAYYDEDSSGQSLAIAPNPFGGVSTTQVTSVNNATAYSKSTYNGFDFSGVGAWTIIDGSTRPLLKSEYSTVITNAHQLQLMTLNKTASYRLAGDIDAGGTMNPSDVWAPTGFVPVGSQSANFAGALEGAGHAITSLTIVTPSSDFVGLFGAIGPSASIADVFVSGAVTGGANVGILAGYSVGTVAGASGKGIATGASQVGALIGYNAGAVAGSSGKAAVSGAGASASALGGLVGSNHGILDSDYATGAVSGDAQVGGLVGVNTGTIRSSYATGAVSGGSGKTAGQKQTAIGGLVGENGGYLTGDQAKGAVSGFEDVGGLVGLNDLIVDFSRASVSPGNVEASAASGAVTGHDYVGGLVGDNQGLIYASSASGAVTGYTRVGGLAGRNRNYGFEATLTDSYATGSVTGMSGPGAPSGSGTLVGGAVGDNTGPVSGIYSAGVVNGASEVGGLVGSNTSMITLSYATGAVSGGSQAGGFAGYNNGGLTNDYATGKVSGSSQAGAFVGLNDSSGQIATSYASGSATFGFAGQNSGTFSSDVFDVDATGATNGVSSGTSAGLTPIGMSIGLNPYQQSSYAGFDFTNTWAIQPGSSRPYLIANPQTPPPTSSPRSPRRRSARGCAAPGPPWRRAWS